MHVVCVTVTTSLIYVALLWTPPNPHPNLVVELEIVSFGWQVKKYDMDDNRPNSQHKYRASPPKSDAI